MNPIYRNILLFLLAIIPINLKAEDTRTITTTARWIKKNGVPAMLVDLSDSLTTSQKDIANSGFSTFTLVAINDSKIQPRDTLPDLRVVCSVKYDTWEERYQTIRVEPLPIETTFVKDFNGWAQKCLQMTLDSKLIVEKMSAGGTFYGIMQIRQSSPDESAKIKKWLVQQQSGFMQGLYAHMLGDFQYQGFVKLEIKIPSIQTNGTPADTKSSPIGKKDGSK